MNLRKLFVLVFLFFSWFISLLDSSSEFYIPDGETDITFDEEFDGIDTVPTVQIALSSFVFWNIFSICFGMCMCCFIQAGYYKFIKETETNEINHKVTPY